MGVGFNMASDKTRCARCGNVGRISGDDPTEVCAKCVRRAEAKVLAGGEDKLRRGAEDKHRAGAHPPGR